MIIVLEGIDNAGKTTIGRYLQDYFCKENKKVVLSKELTTDVGEVIKNRIHRGGLSPISKAFLFAADRQLRLDALRIADNPETIFIFDRYIHSAIVYREAEGLDGNWVRELNKDVPKSDLTFYIDITPEESIKRNTNTKFNIHYSISRLKTVRERYLYYTGKGELVFIDGMKDIDCIQRQIVEEIKRHL